MSKLNDDKLKSLVREGYKKIAINEESMKGSSEEISESIGYSLEDMENVPQNSNLGLGCGNPQLVADLKDGETVLDLGSGAGFDCFIASKKVGKSGLVIGVDMTPEMLSQARENAHIDGYKNIDFRLGEIENIPVADGIVDVIISNCVINLSPNKQRVYDEAYRVLKDGGRIAISDIVLFKDLTDEMKEDENLYCGWVTGASSVEELRGYVERAGFKDIQIETKEVSREYAEKWGHKFNIGEFVFSSILIAKK